MKTKLTISILAILLILVIRGLPLGMNEADEVVNFVDSCANQHEIKACVCKESEAKKLNVELNLSVDGFTLTDRKILDRVLNPREFIVNARGNGTHRYIFVHKPYFDSLCIERVFKK